MDDDRYVHIVKSQPALSGFNFYKYVNNDVVTTCHLRKNNWNRLDYTKGFNKYTSKFKKWVLAA